jgi:hypothetical protein
VSGGAASAGSPPLEDRRLPPVRELAVATLILVVVGTIYLAAHLPKAAPIGVPAGFLAAAAVLLGVNAVMLARTPDFAWARFRQVFGWALLAYSAIAGMLVYAFVIDHTAGSRLVVMTLMLVVFALDVPFLLAFSVARYADPETR